MIDLVEPAESARLEEYERRARLTPQVQKLKATADAHRNRLEGGTVWMVNSTDEGGGVAEMMPTLVTLLSELGVPVQWAVIRPEREAFFALTKQIHNLIHDRGDPDLGAEDRALYEQVSRDLADQFQERLGPNDILVVHDPQPAGMGALLADRLEIPAVWRSHIGIDRTTRRTEAAWSFLKPWLSAYDRAVFTLEEYVPGYLRERASTIAPGIDPISDKNRELPVHKISGILANASLTSTAQAVFTPPFSEPARRVQEDGSLVPAHQPEDIGLLYRPIVSQISRWDRLKGFGPLLEGFARLKREAIKKRDTGDSRHDLRLEMVRLVLAGPDPHAIEDDPESQKVFDELANRWLELPTSIQRDLAIICLPMAVRAQNALMVNALQRCSSIVVQNSLEEGFGLTVTEGLWKGAPVLGTSAAGIRAQVEDGRHGLIVDDPTDSNAVAEGLDTMLRQRDRRNVWAINAKKHVTDHYLVLRQARDWIEILADRTSGRQM